jgi:hypothetical protein
MHPHRKWKRPLRGTNSMLGRNDRIVLDTLLPAGGHPNLPSGIFGAGFDAFFAEFERDADRSLRMGFRVALWVAIWLAPLLVRRMPPLSRHDRATRERALIALGSSRIYLFRQLLLLLKTITALCYGANGRVRAAVGHPSRQLEQSGQS